MTKVLTLIYNRFNSEYGINQCDFDGFYRETYRIQDRTSQKDLELRLKEFLIKNELLRRRLEIRIPYPDKENTIEERNKITDLTNLIIKLNPKTKITSK